MTGKMKVAGLKHPENLQDLLAGLGKVDASRIGLPVGGATEAEVLRALEGTNKRLYELADGVLLEKVMGWKESLIAGRLLAALWEYLEAHPLGTLLTADGPVRLQPGRIRIPDISFISWERMPDDEDEDDGILDAVPDLAVEVLSKGNTPEEMTRKLRDYFRAGVRLVWVLDPRAKTAAVHTGVNRKRDIGKDGSLEGGKVLPGFVIPLKKVFSTGRRGK